MEFIMQVCGAMLAVAGCLLVLSITAIAFYVVVVGIKSAIDESKLAATKDKKKGKRAK